MGIFSPTDSLFSEPSQSMWICKFCNWAQWDSWLVEFQAQMLEMFWGHSCLRILSEKWESPGACSPWVVGSRYVQRGSERAPVLLRPLRWPLTGFSDISHSGLSTSGPVSPCYDLRGDGPTEWLGPMSLSQRWFKPSHRPNFRKAVFELSLVPSSGFHGIAARTPD